MSPAGPSRRKYAFASPLASTATELTPRFAPRSDPGSVAQCKGLSEEFLHALDQEDSEWLTTRYPGGQATYPRCERCEKNGIDCTFAPSRRKGRPRRLPASAATDSAGVGAGQSSGGEQPPQASSDAASSSSARHHHHHRPRRQNGSDSSASSIEDEQHPHPSTSTAVRGGIAASRVNRRHEQRRRAEQPYSVSSAPAPGDAHGRYGGAGVGPPDDHQAFHLPPRLVPDSSGDRYRASSSPLSSSSPHTPVTATTTAAAAAVHGRSVLASASPVEPHRPSPLLPPLAHPGGYGATTHPAQYPAPPLPAAPMSAPFLSGGGMGSITPPMPGYHSQPSQQQPFVLSPLSSNGSLSRPSPPSARGSDEWLLSTASSLPSEKQQQPYLGHLHALAARFLDEAYEWVPFLPSTHGGLVSHLACSRPILTEALECLLDPLERPCPCLDFQDDDDPNNKHAGGAGDEGGGGPGASARRDGLTQPSLADLQAAAVLSVLAFAQRERQRSIDLLQWACRQMLARGWNGERTVLDDPVFSRSGLEDVDQLMDLGWYLWGIEVQLGIITGQRASILAPVVPPPAQLDESTARKHSFHVAFLATDYAHLWSLETDQSRCAYLRKVLTRVHDVHNVCVAALRTHKLPPYPVQLNAVADRAKRQDWILGGMLALAGGILILSSASPLSPYVAPALPCSLDTTARPAPNSRHLYAIASSAKGIVRLLKEFGTNSVSPAAFPPLSTAAHYPELTGSPLVAHADADGDERMQLYDWPETIHHPFFGCCLVVAARGLLILSEDLQADIASKSGPAPTSAEPGRAHAWLSSTSADPHVELAKISRDLDLCEGFLRVQARRWKASEMLANEVGLLRRTAGFA